MRVIIAVRNLFGRHGEGVAALLDHVAHLAHAFGALGRALVAFEHLARARGAGLDGQGHIALTQAVAVADVHEGITRSMRLIMVLYNDHKGDCKSFARLRR